MRDVWHIYIGSDCRIRLMFGLNTICVFDFACEAEKDDRLSDDYPWPSAKTAVNAAYDLAEILNVIRYNPHEAPTRTEAAPISATLEQLS